MEGDFLFPVTWAVEVVLDFSELYIESLEIFVLKNSEKESFLYLFAFPEKILKFENQSETHILKS